jgi:hypothetical protein
MRLRRSWKLALGLVVIMVAIMLTTRLWTAQIARSLTCAESLAPSDAMLVENFDPHYPLFEQAATLERERLAPLTLVPVETSREPNVANPVSLGIAEVMARQARLRRWRTILITTREPISLNAALQMRPQLRANGITSVTVIAPRFRSRRSLLVYGKTFGAYGITVRCIPVPGQVGTERWTDTWHGIQQVIEEFIKLQYYRFYVMPFVAPSAGGG